HPSSGLFLQASPTKRCSATTDPEALQPSHENGPAPGPFSCPRSAGVSDEELTAIGRDGRTGDEAGFIRDKEDYTARDLRRLAETADRDLRNDALAHLFRHGHHHVGADIAGADGVDGDAGPRTLLCQRLGEAEVARLGGR